MAVSSSAAAGAQKMTGEERKVIFASSLGTVFEWYDFYLYGTLASFIGAAFFNEYPEATRNIFVLLAFAAGFLVRPFGALVFGRIGDLVGRKYTFLVTIVIMGGSTFLVGLLPGSASLGIFAPIILIALRMLQGLALGGEYGGAAWGWRIPFLVSVLLLGISVWIRMQMSESPAFKRMKEEGKTSKAPLSEAFGQWKNAKIALIALFGLTAGQAVVWYCGQFYALFFLQNVLKVENQSANIMVAIALLIGTGFFVIFGWLSDKIGRKPIIMAGLILAAVTYFPLFKALTNAANPALVQAEQTVKATVTAAPGDCNFQFNATGTSKFTTSCDVATSFLAKSSVPYETVQTAAPGTPATITIGDTTIQSYDAVQAGADAAAKQAALAHGVNLALQQAGFPLVRDTAKVPDSKLDAFVAANPELQLNADAIRAGDAKTMVSAADLVKQKLLTQSEAESLGVSSEQAVYSIPNAGAFKMVADPAQVNWVLTIAILTILVIYVTMVYGPIAAILVEMFPTRIRYNGMSLPYHIGNGWFGGLLPAGVFALSAAKGDIYYGLWYPIIIASVTFVIGMLFVKETKGVDLNKVD
ncbi:MFS transporter [Brucella abortus]|uniref:MFS transporter n=1 Tax=Brucella abortus TaxID=235 RepID=UPI0002D13331|nr:MFS transporter [Brucella abortus]ENR66172.1 hypothetical protein C032_02312 [Brucella abortus 63/294]ERU05477.1 hypothetical protein P039_01775 [Brucella abortus 07-0994-2411]